MLMYGCRLDMEDTVKIATTNEIGNWQDNALSETLRWHRAVGKHSESSLLAYEAGFKAGWRMAISTLKLHDAKPETQAEERKRRA